MDRKIVTYGGYFERFIQGLTKKEQLKVKYGLLLLKLQKKEISTETQQAAGHISTMLGTLSDYYLKDKTEPIEF